MQTGLQHSPPGTPGNLLLLALRLERVLRAEAALGPVLGQLRLDAGLGLGVLLLLLPPQELLVPELLLPLFL